MNKSKQFAYTVNVVLIVFFVTIIIIFPIFLNFNLKLSTKDLILNYKIKLFFFTIINGYAEIIDEGIALHLSKKFAIVFTFKDLLNMRNKVKPLRDYHLLKLNVKLNFGANDNFLLTTNIAFIINYFQHYLKWFLYHHKPYFSFINQLNVYEDKSYSSLSISGQIIFNLLMILLSVIKILVGKLKNAFARQK